MKSMILALILLISSQAMAIDCNLIVVTEEEVIEKSFTVPLESQGHEVPEMTIQGTVNEVTAMADGKWLGLRWSKNNELIAESVNLIRDTITQARVLIMYNPKNTDEQVSLDCSQGEETSIPQ